MASVSDLAAAVRAGLTAISTARTALERAYALTGELAKTWRRVLIGTNDSEAAGLPALEEATTQSIGTCRAATAQAESLLTAYLGSLAVDLPVAPAPAAKGVTHTYAQRIAQARTRGGAVIDRAVCGTRDTDREQPFTCGQVPTPVLVTRARSRVVQPDGTVRVYTGTEMERR
ncbi:hypothetical protein ACWEOE_13450 [Amycolatopsis sp. NPDC004368]